MGAESGTATLGSGSESTRAGWLAYLSGVLAKTSMLTSRTKGYSAKTLKSAKTYDSNDGRFSVVFEGGHSTSFVTANGMFATQKGIRPGMNVDALKQAYGVSLSMEANPYCGADHFVWQSPDSGIRLFVDETGAIRTIRSGTQYIRYVEGCL